MNQDNKSTLLQYKNELQEFVDDFGKSFSMNTKCKKSFIVEMTPEISFNEELKDYYISLITIISYISVEKDTITQLFRFDSQNMPFDNEIIMSLCKSIKFHFINTILFGKYDEDTTIINAIINDSFKITENEIN